MERRKLAAANKLAAKMDELEGVADSVQKVINEITSITGNAVVTIGVCGEDNNESTIRHREVFNVSHEYLTILIDQIRKEALRKRHLIAEAFEEL